MGNDLQTVLLLYSAFPCIFRFFGLSPLDTVTTLMLSHLASFLPFPEVIPAFITYSCFVFSIRIGAKWGISRRPKSLGISLNFPFILTKSVYSLSVWSEMRVGLWYWGSHIFLFLRCKVCLWLGRLHLLGINKERSIQTSTGNRIQEYRIFSVSREMRTNCGHKRQNLIRILQASSIIMGLRSGLGSCNTAIISRSSFNSCMILHMACGRSLNVRFCNSSIIASYLS